MALVAAVGAVAFVVSSSTGNDGGGSDGNASRTAEPRPRDEGSRQRQRPQRRFYRVRLNDTLEAIAEQTGVPVEQLQALNPELDPQNLIVGQRIRLRE